MKTADLIKIRIAELVKEKGKVIDSRIKTADNGLIDFYDAEIIRYNFMIQELEWVLKK